MIKNFVPYFVILFMLSCNRPDNSCGILSSENMELKSKIDSLEKSNALLTAQQESKQPGRKKRNQHTSHSTRNANLPVFVPVVPDKKLSSSTVPVVRRQISSNASSYSGQCMAITKKGSRCSRTARSGGYCWQHGG